MRNLHELDRFRMTGPDIIAYFGGIGDEICGVFEVPVPNKKTGLTARLRVLASGEAGWDHVSVSLPSRCPTWAEMSAIHRMFFAPGEVAMQLHVPAADHINVHPYCLHLWRPHAAPVPLPEKWMVA